MKNFLPSNVLTEIFCESIGANVLPDITGLGVNKGVEVSVGMVGLGIRPWRCAIIVI